MKALSAFPVARIGATLVAFLLGIYGFSSAYASGPGSTLSDNAFKALQLVFGQYPADLHGRPVPWSLHVARWALPLLTLWTTIALAWVQVRNPLRLRWIARRGEHLVLAGDAGVAAGIVRAERLARRPTILWTDDGTASWVARSADAGAPHSPTHGDDSGAALTGIDRARAVLLVDDDATRNVALAAAAVAEARRCRPPGDPLPVIARVDDLDLRDAIDERFARSGDSATARVRTISVPDILARHLFRTQPVDRFVRIGSDRRLILAIGFSAAIERYVVRMLAGGHFRNGGRPHFVILDGRAAMTEQVFRARRPNADLMAPVVFEQANVDQPALLGAVLKEVIARHGLPSALVIDPDDPVRALALAFAADSFFRSAGLAAPFIHVNTGDCPEEQLGSAILPFGGGAVLGNSEALLQEQHDELARAIHDTYLEGQLGDGFMIGSRASMHEWEDLPEKFRDDNRLLADCYQLKLRDIDARLVPGDGDGFRLEPDEIEELAHAEHDRWMAAKLIDGWTFGATRDDTLRRHPDIIPYDDLSEKVKELDREQIRFMNRLLPGTSVVPRRVLLVGLGREDGARTDPLQTAVAKLAARYPDRVLIFIGSFNDEAIRSALLQLAESGAVVQLLLTGNAQDIIDTLPHDQRIAARRMMRQADRIYAFGPGELVVASDPEITIGVAEDGLAIAMPGRG